MEKTPEYNRSLKFAYKDNEKLIVNMKRAIRIYSESDSVLAVERINKCKRILSIAESIR